MKKIHVEKAHFVKSAVAASGYPEMVDDKGELLPEIAFVGRSNVGKSSLINHLLRRRKLARTSSTPGKTQEINFFSINDDILFVDLPGYGYAKVSKTTKSKWGKMIQTYLDSRTSLKLVLLLFDARRKPNKEDLMLMEWFIHYGVEVMIVFTKIDKISTTKRKSHMEKVLTDLECVGVQTGCYSVTKNIGRTELINAINKLNLGGTLV